MSLKFRQRGVTSIEYALLAALIAMAVVVALTATGIANDDLWGRWTARVFAAIQSAIP